MNQKYLYSNEKKTDANVEIAQVSELSEKDFKALMKDAFCAIMNIFEINVKMANLGNEIVSERMMIERRNKWIF